MNENKKEAKEERVLSVATHEVGDVLSPGGGARLRTEPDRDRVQYRTLTTCTIHSTLTCMTCSTLIHDVQRTLIIE